MVIENGAIENGHRKWSHRKQSHFPAKLDSDWLSDHAGFSLVLIITCVGEVFFKLSHTNNLEQEGHGS